MVRHTALWVLTCLVVMVLMGIIEHHAEAGGWLPVVKLVYTFIVAVRVTDWIVGRGPR